MFRLCVLMLVCWGCSPSEKKIQSKEEYPDFSEEKSTPASQPSVTMCGSSPSVARAHYHVVEICQMKFVPSELNITRGDTVEWINKDITNHCVSEEHSKIWQSPSLASGKSWKKIVTSSTDYFCSIHLVMKGKITADEKPNN